MSVRGTAEVAVFGALAAALHLAFWWQAPREGVLDAAGSGGTQLVSLQAVSAEIAAQLDAVDTPPDVADAPETAPPQPVMPTAPAPAAPAAPVLRGTAPELPDVSGAGLALPQISRPPARAVAPEVPEIAAPEPPADTPPPPTRPTAPARPEPPQTAEVTATPEPPAPSAVPEPPAPSLPEATIAASPVPPRRPADLKVPARSVQSRPAPEAPPNSTRNSAGQAETRAAGTGGGALAGNSGRNDTASMSGAERANLMSTWGARIAQRIQRRTVRIRAEGTVVVALSVTSDGRLAGVSLARSSGDAAVDSAAIDAVRRAGRFPKAPRGLPPGTHNFRLPIRIDG